MPKSTPLIAVGAAIIIAVLVGGYFFLNKKSQAPQEPSVTSQEQKSETGGIKSSIKSLLSGGKNVTCTVKYPSADQTAEGKIYVSGQKMRGDFNMMVSGKAIESHMISDEAYIYSWSSEAKQGVKFKVDQTEAKASPTSESVDIDKEVDMDCSSWGVDNSKFSIPPDIQFTDLSEMMKQTPASGGQNQGSSACEAITDPAAKAACIKASSGY